MENFALTTTDTDITNDLPIPNTTTSREIPLAAIEHYEEMFGPLLKNGRQRLRDAYRENPGGVRLLLQTVADEASVGSLRNPWGIVLYRLREGLHLDYVEPESLADGVYSDIRVETELREGAYWLMPQGFAALPILCELSTFAPNEMQFAVRDGAVVGLRTTWD